MKKLPPHITSRHYTTSGGEKRTIYRIRFTDWKGVERFFPGTDNLKSAVRIRDFRLGQNALRYDFDQEKQERYVRSQTFFSWADRWLSLKQDKRSHEKDEMSVSRLKEFFGNVQLADLSASRIEEYKNSRRHQLTRYGRAPQPATINRELACLRSLLIAASEEGLIAKKPPIKFFPEFARRDRLAAEEEYQAILRLVGPLRRIPLLMMREMGIRISEAACVRWEQLNFPQQTIHLGLTKSGEPRVVPMSPGVYAEMMTMPKQAQGPVFRNEKGEPLTRFMLTHSFKRACKLAGIEGLWRHDLRRTFSTSKLREGWDREFVKRAMGLRTDAALQHYNRPTLDDVRRVVGWSSDGPQKSAMVEKPEEKSATP